MCNKKTKNYLALGPADIFLACQKRSVINCMSLFSKSEEVVNCNSSIKLRWTDIEHIVSIFQSPKATYFPTYLNTWHINAVFLYFLWTLLSQSSCSMWIMWIKRYWWLMDGCFLIKRVSVPLLWTWYLRIFYEFCPKFHLDELIWLWWSKVKVSVTWHNTRVKNLYAYYDKVHLMQFIKFLQSLHSLHVSCECERT